jgi:hypothetical protein
MKFRQIKMQKKQLPIPIMPNFLQTFFPGSFRTIVGNDPADGY